MSTSKTNVSARAAARNAQHRCVVKVYRAHRSGLRKPVFLNLADYPHATCPRTH